MGLVETRSGYSYNESRIRVPIGWMGSSRRFHDSFKVIWMDGMIGYSHEES